MFRQIQKRMEKAKMKSFWRISLAVMALFILIAASGCKENQKEYYEVHIRNTYVSDINYFSFVKGEKVERPADPVREGYTFVGWYVNDEIWDFENDIIERDTDIVAKWEPIKYNITYHLNNGEQDTSNPNTFTFENEVIYLQSPSRTGYEFTGWHLDESLTDDPIDSFIPSSEDIELYASWKANRYYVDYVLTYPSKQKIRDIIIDSSYIFNRTQGYAISSDGHILKWNQTTDSILAKLPAKLYLYEGWQSFTGNYQNYFGIAKTSHSVVPWGTNSYGQLGNGTTNEENTNFHVSKYLVFSGLEADEYIENVFSSGYHSFALTNKGKVYAWGLNDYGQLGDGTIVDRLTPVLLNINLNPNERIMKMSLNINTTLALTSSGRILAWGLNDYGNLGIPNGDSIKTVANPTEIDDSMLVFGEYFTQVHAGIQTSYAITNTGKLYAFGDNSNNLLGTAYDAEQGYFYTPTLVNIQGLEYGEKIMSVHSSIDHALALTNLGHVYSWGKVNTYGQLGNGPRSDGLFYIPRIVTFQEILGNEKIDVIRTYGYSSFAISNLGRVFAWGNNYHNELGFGNFNAHLWPAVWEDIYESKTEYTYNSHSFDQSFYPWSPVTPAGMKFSGWFLDRQMTIPFTGTQLPVGGLTLYGKHTWVDEN